MKLVEYIKPEPKGRGPYILTDEKDVKEGDEAQPIPPEEERSVDEAAEPEFSSEGDESGEGMSGRPFGPVPDSPEEGEKDDARTSGLGKEPEAPSMPREERRQDGQWHPPVAGEKDESEPEVLFPMEREEYGGLGKKQTPRAAVKIITVGGLLVLAYLVGVATGPGTWGETKKKLQNLFSVAVQKFQPIKDRIEDMIVKEGRGKPGTEFSEGSDTRVKRRIKYWQAPMDPSYISDKPGKGPMGMDLVPVYEDGQEAGQIWINPTVVQNIGVKTETVRIRKLTREIRTVGRVTFDERLVMHIHTKYEGWIEKLYVNFTGQEVKEGDLLVEIYSPELVSTQEELLTALKYRDTLKKSPFREIGQGADSLLKSTIRRLQLFDVPQHQIDELMRSRKIKKTMHIHSHQQGFVVHKKALHGMHVLPGMSLYSIVDLSNIWVLADIYEYEFPWVKLGQKVEMSLSYYPGKIFRGTVTYIDPFLEPKTRTIKVRMEFDNPDWQLKPNMYANVTLKSEIAKRAVAVPEEAVLRSGERDVVIIRNDSGSFQARDVILGAQSQGYFQVMDGISPGEVVVVSSNFLIDAESKLSEAIKMMEDEPLQLDLKLDAGNSNRRRDNQARLP